MGGGSSIHKLPETEYEKLKCSKCEAYLSCCPLKSLPNGKVLCGRCNGTDYVHEVLSEKLFANVHFPCSYKKSGCSEYALFNHVQNHETTCTYRTFMCPTLNAQCSKKISLRDAKTHFLETHPQFIIENNEFIFQIFDKEVKKSLVLFINADLIVVYYEYHVVKNIFEISISRVTYEPNNVLKFNLQFIKPENKYCFATVSKHMECGIYRTPLEGESDVFQVLAGVLTCSRNNVYEIAVKDLCPILNNLDCNGVAFPQLESCITTKIFGLNDEQIVTVLRSLVEYVNKYSNILNCTTQHLLSICPNICATPGVVLCPNNVINLDLLITYTQNGDVGRHCRQ
ncbi:hypothetical protein FQR65_LT02058 [Abscondita terminalis]|nr:hypothetical protein FQR65_LT02058 [Abscondita terminalis]